MDTFVARARGTSTVTDAGRGTVDGGVASAKVVGQLTTVRLVATSSPVVPVDGVVPVDAEVPVDGVVDVEGRLVEGRVVVGGRAACGELSAHPAARTATTMEPMMGKSDFFRISPLFHRVELDPDHPARSSRSSCPRCPPRLQLSKFMA